MRVCVYVRACVSQYDRLRNDVIRMIRQCIYTHREREPVYVRVIGDGGGGGGGGGRGRERG